MARQFTKASSQYLINSNAPVTAAPFTINYWVYPDNSSTDRYILGLGNSGSNQGWFPHLLNSSNIHRSWINDGGFNNFLAGAMTANAWNMGTLSTASSTSRYLYTNAVQGSQNTTSRTPTVNQFGIGGRIRSTIDLYFDGRIGEVAIWNVELTQAEVSTLYNSGVMGVPAWTIRPDALVSYWKLLDDDGDIDWAHSGTYDLTATNSPAHADHPPISMWLPMAATLIPAQAGGPTVVGVGIATETDAALGVQVAPKRRLVTTASETDAALTAAPVKSGPQVIPVGIASETDAASAVDINPFRRLVGVASETDAALVVTSSKAKIVAVGIATETDAALAIDINPFRRLVGIATETDTAFSVTTIVPQSIAVGIASETDAALAVTASGGVLESVETIFNIPAAKRSYYNINLES